MTALPEAVSTILARQSASDKPLAVVLAGHNGSGKSTLWYEQLADRIQIPLVNADRMMLSILPEASADRPLPKWASRLRDEDEGWMRVAQKGVEAFVAQAMDHGVPFATETVFSYLKEATNGRILASKADLIRQIQGAGYFVLLLFVGLARAELSIARVGTRVAMGGHAVEVARLRARFPRTQKAIRHAAGIADATIMVDNSRGPESAFSVCRVQLGDQRVFDVRNSHRPVAKTTLRWLDVVSPR